MLTTETISITYVALSGQIPLVLPGHFWKQATNMYPNWEFNSCILCNFIPTVVAHPVCFASHIAPSSTITIVLSLMQLYSVYNDKSKSDTSD